VKQVQVDHYSWYFQTQLYAIAIGNAAQATSTNSIVIGNAATLTATTPNNDSIVIGTKSIGHRVSIAMGNKRVIRVVILLLLDFVQNLLSKVLQLVRIQFHQDKEQLLLEQVLFLVLVEFL
jgi:hypothetical protein